VDKRRTGSSAMRKSKIPQAAEARRGVRAVVRVGERKVIVCMVERGECARRVVRGVVDQPVPIMRMFGLVFWEEGEWERA
jgi:hypothetical protein